MSQSADLGCFSCALPECGLLGSAPFSNSRPHTEVAPAGIKSVNDAHESMIASIETHLLRIAHLRLSLNMNLTINIKARQWSQSYKKN